MERVIDQPMAAGNFYFDNTLQDGDGKVALCRYIIVISLYVTIVKSLIFPY